MTETTIDAAPSRPRAAARPDGLALGAALVTVVLWASAFVGIRDAGSEISAGPLSLGRLVVASVALGVLVAVRREALPPRADVPRLVLCSLLWFAAYNVILNTAEHDVDAGTAAMLVNTGPIIIARARRPAAARGLPARTDRGLRDRVRGRRRHRGRDVRARRRRRMGRGAVPRGGGRVRRRRRRAEAAARAHVARCRSRSSPVRSRRSRACRSRRTSSTTCAARARRRSPGRSTSARSRPRSGSRRGRSR